MADGWLATLGIGVVLAIGLTVGLTIVGSIFAANYRDVAIAEAGGDLAAVECARRASSWESEFCKTYSAKVGDSND